MAGFFVPESRKQMALYAYATPISPPDPATEHQCEEPTETTESEEN